MNKRGLSGQKSFKKEKPDESFYEYYDEEDDDETTINLDITKIDGIKLSVPKLMLLGILYTASSARQRAERFYELIQGELDAFIETADEEFKDFFPLIGQICYQTIVKHYNKRVNELNKNHEAYVLKYP